MKNKNEMLKAAFEEAAKVELEKLPDEERIIRPYSEEFRNKMNELFEEENVEEKKLHFRFGKVAVIAAVLIVMLTFSASGMILGENWINLFKFEIDPENYETIDIAVEGAIVKEDDYDTLIYNGEPITIKYDVDTGESWEWPDKDLMVFVDGVRQTFSVKNDEGEYKNIEALHLENEKGLQKEFEITFEPNIGKKGDELYLSVVAVFDPDVDYYPQCNTEGKSLFVSHFDDDNDRICDKCEINIDDPALRGPTPYTISTEGMIRIVMKKDAPSQSEIASDFSGTTISELDERIYKGYEYEDLSGEKYNQYDTIEGLVAEVYKDIKEAHYTEWGVSYHALRIKTKAAEDDEFIINLHGAEGKYRISLYINNEIQGAFDGLCYTDVNIVKGKQIELAFNIDTTKLLKGDNYCFVLYEKLDGEANILREVENGLVYTIEVK